MNWNKFGKSVLKATITALSGPEAAKNSHLERIRERGRRNALEGFEKDTIYYIGDNERLKAYNEGYMQGSIERNNK